MHRNENQSQTAHICKTQKNYNKTDLKHDSKNLWSRRRRILLLINHIQCNSQSLTFSGMWSWRLGLEAVSRRSSASARSRLGFGTPQPRLGLELWRPWSRSRVKRPRAHPWILDGIYWLVITNLSYDCFISLLANIKQRLSPQSYTESENLLFLYQFTVF